MALYYLNRGIILEQAICEIIKEYLETLNLDNIYSNFHVSVTTEHPFANLYLNDGLNASDSFPCVVVSTQEDRKPSDFDLLAPSVYKISLDEKTLEEIIKTTDESKKTIAGLCTIADEQTLNAIKATIEKQGEIFGCAIRTRRKDSLSVEIWSENTQLKNELYEQIRLFIAGNFRHILTEKYPFFDIALFDDSIVGHRSNNYNFDFDVVLTGAHIAFDLNYCIEQLILDTNATDSKIEILSTINNLTL